MSSKERYVMREDGRIEKQSTNKYGLFVREPDPVYVPKIAARIEYGRLSKKDSNVVEKIEIRGDMRMLARFMRRAKECSRFRVTARVRDLKSFTSKGIIHLRPEMATKEKLDELSLYGIKIDPELSPRILIDSKPEKYTLKQRLLLDTRSCGFRNDQHRLEVEEAEKEMKATGIPYSKRESKQSARQLIRSLVRSGMSKEEIAQIISPE